MLDTEEKSSARRCRPAAHTTMAAAAAIKDHRAQRQAKLLEAGEAPCLKHAMNGVAFSLDFSDGEHAQRPVFPAALARKANRVADHVVATADCVVRCEEAKRLREEFQKEEATMQRKVTV